MATEALLSAIAACRASGGGTLCFPPGEFITAPLDLCSNLALHLEAGAVLRFSERMEDYPARFVRWEGCECIGYSPGFYSKGLGEADGKGNFCAPV